MECREGCCGRDQWGRCHWESLPEEVLSCCTVSNEREPAGEDRWGGAASRQKSMHRGPAGTAWGWLARRVWPAGSESALMCRHHVTLGTLPNHLSSFSFFTWKVRTRIESTM